MAKNLAKSSLGLTCFRRVVRGEVCIGVGDQDDYKQRVDREAAGYDETLAIQGWRNVRKRRDAG